MRNKYVPCLLYAFEAYHLISREKKCFEFTVTKSLMKLFCTGSASHPLIVRRFFETFTSQLYVTDLSNAQVPQHYAASDNCVCQCFSIIACRNHTKISEPNVLKNDLYLITVSSLR
jgi:hypothetical protein